MDSVGRGLRGWGQQGVRAPARLAWADTGDPRPARHRARTWANTGTSTPFPGAWPWGARPWGENCLNTVRGVAWHRRRGLTPGGAWPAPCPPADSNLKHALSRLNLFARRGDVSGAGRPTANERAAGSAPPHLPPWSPRPPASRCCCKRPSSWSTASTGTRSAWPRPSTATPRSALRRRAGPWAASGERWETGWVGGRRRSVAAVLITRVSSAGRCTTRWRSTGMGA